MNFESFSSTLNGIVVTLGWAGGLVLLVLVAMFMQDIFQSKHTVRRNFPIIGRLRYFLGRQGEFFRQYVFASDRQEMPFNHATRFSHHRRRRGRQRCAAWALCLGADFVNTARGFMFALGCIQSMKCHTNQCPTGVTTHNKRLQRGLVVGEKSQRVANYVLSMNREIDMIAHSCGVTHARELRRMHARIVVSAGKSVRLDHLYPYPNDARVADAVNVVPGMVTASGKGGA